MTPRTHFTLFWFVAALGFSGRAQTADTKLVFDDVKTMTIFASLAPDCNAGQAPPNYEKMWKGLTEHFALYLKPASIDMLKDGGGFDYMFYLADRRSNPPAWLECDTQVFPQGTFVDSFQDVHFTVISDGLKEPGVIRAPIHSLQENDFLEFKKPATPMNISISGSTDLEIPLHSVVNDFKLIIARTPAIESSHGEYWGAWDKLSLPEDRSLTGNDTIKIPTPVVRRMAVLFGTLTSLKPDAVHDTLKIDLFYKSDLGGELRRKHIDLDVRFVPSIVSLLLALVAGSFLGTIAGQTLPGSWKGRKAALLTAARALLYSALAELGALFLVGQGSKFVLFDLQLDPLQVLSVFFIGLFTSGGKAIVQLTMKPSQKPAATPPPNSPPGSDPPLVPPPSAGEVAP